MRLIDADALMKTLGITDMDCDKCAWHDREWSNCKRGGDFEDACCAIEDAPTIEERKTGRWIYKKDLKQFFCDQCGEPSLTEDDRYIYSMDFSNFCPNCGAKMEVEHDT